MLYVEIILWKLVLNAMQIKIQRVPKNVPLHGVFVIMLIISIVFLGGLKLEVLVHWITDNGIIKNMENDFK